MQFYTIYIFYIYKYIRREAKHGYSIQTGYVKLSKGASWISDENK